MDADAIHDTYSTTRQSVLVKYFNGANKRSTSHSRLMYANFTNDTDAGITKDHWMVQK